MQLRDDILGSGSLVGGRTLAVDRALPRGDVAKEGLTGNSVLRNMVYFYRRVEGSPFFVGLVIEGTVSNPTASVSSWVVPARRLKTLSSIPECGE